MNRGRCRVRAIFQALIDGRRPISRQHLRDFDLVTALHLLDLLGAAFFRSPAILGSNRIWVDQLLCEDWFGEYTVKPSERGHMPRAGWTQSQQIDRRSAKDAGRRRMHPWRDLSIRGPGPPAGENCFAGAISPDGAEWLARHCGAPEPEHFDNRQGGFMRRFAVLVAAALLMMSCSPDEEVTGSIHHKCANELFSRFDPKSLEQCVAVCIKCDRGTTATCSTSCTLKGAH